MAPNCKGEKLPVSECAAPFKDKRNGSSGSKPSLVQNGNPSAFVSLNHEESRQAETSLRVNTTHQYTYELDKYRKNAMLVFHYDNAYHGSKETANKVRDTFEKFRFEVEVHHNATGDEVKAISETFFRRDFCEYGAVGIVVIGNVNNDGKYITPGAEFTDRNILDNILLSNLQSKPKIVIFECDRVPKRYYSTYTDVIDYTFPVLVHTSAEPNGVCNPLSFYCDKVDVLADQESLQNILLEVIHEAKRNNWKRPPTHLDGALIIDDHQNMVLQLHARMPKQLFLWRNPVSHTD